MTSPSGSIGIGVSISADDLDMQITRAVQDAMADVLARVRRGLRDVEGAFGGIDLSAFLDVIERQTRGAGRSMEQTMERSARRAGGEVADAFADGARAASRSLDRIDASALTRITRGAQGAEQELRQLNRQQLRDLIDSAQRAGQMLGQEIPAGASHAERALRRMSGDQLDQLIRDARRAEQALGDVGNAGRDAGRDTERASEGASDRLRDMATAAAGAAAGIAGIAGAADTIGTVFERTDIGNRLAAQLDLTKEQSEEAGRIAGRLYANAYGEDFQAVNDAIGAVASSLRGLGTDGADQIEGLSIAALDFEATFGIETAESVQTITQLLRNGLAKDGVEAFDLLTTSFQRVGPAMREEIPELINEYGTFFSSIGFSGPEAFGLLVNASDQGKIAMDKMGDSIKEFGIRAADLGDTGAVEALDTIGLAGEDIQNRLLAGGDTAKVAFQQMVAALLEVEVPAEQAAASLALFGTPLEDLNNTEIPAFLLAMSNSGEAMLGFEGAADRMGEKLNAGPGVALETFKRSVQSSIIEGLGNAVVYFRENEEVAITLAAAIGTLVTAYVALRAAGVVGAVIQGVSAAMSGAALAANASAVSTGAYTIALGAQRAAALASAAATNVATVATKAFSASLAFLAANPIVLAIAAIVAALVLFFTKTELGREIFEKLKNAVVAAWEKIQDAAVAAWNFLRPIFESIAEWVTGTLIPAFMALWKNVIEPAFKAIGAAISFWWNNIVQPIFTAVVGFITGTLWPAIQRLVADVKEAWDVWSALISLWWNNVVKPIFGLLVDIVQNVVGPAILWLWNNVVSPAFEGMGEIISFVWDNIIKPVWDALKLGIDVIGAAVTWLNAEIIQPVWSAIGDVINTVWTTVISPVWEALKSGLAVLGTVFENTVNGISTVWNKLKEAAAAPVRFVIEKVWNNGLVEAWNKIEPFIPGIDKIEKIEVGFARGGVLPGYTPGRDVHKFISADGRMGLNLSGGEGIARPEVVRALGMGRWDAMNAAARSGGVSGVRRFFGFATGGVIPTTMARLIQERWPDMEFVSGLRFTDTGYHSRNMAGDFATAAVPSRSMQETAAWIYATYGPETLELIHWPLRGWENIKNGAAFNYGQPTNDQHRDHVHWAMDHPPGDPGDKPGGVFSSLRELPGRLFGSIKNRIADIFDGIMRGIADAMPTFGDSKFGEIPKGFLEFVRTKVREFLVGQATSEDDKRGSFQGDPGAGVEQWRPLVRELLTHYALPLSLTNSVLRRMNQESGGNTGAVNLWDSNAAKGTPSVGLMQVIGPTYADHKDPIFDEGPYLYGVSVDPEANLAASMRYALARYGSLSAAYDRPGGYQRGGTVGGFGLGDTMPALLEPGEFVINRRAAARYGPLLARLNASVPRFQEGGDTAIGGLVGLVTVPVQVMNWHDGAAVFRSAVAAETAPVTDTATAAVDAAPAETTGSAQGVTETVTAASMDVVTTALEAIGTGINTILGDGIAALTGATKDAVDALTVRRPASTELIADDQLPLDEQGRILTDTKTLLERTATSEAEVRQRQFEEQMKMLTDIADKLSAGVLGPIMQAAVDAGIGIVEDWLGGVADDVVKGTDRTTDAVEDLDQTVQNKDFGGDSGAAPFGSPGSSFDAAQAISDAIVSVADAASAAFQQVANDIAQAALAQTPSRVDESRGVLGRDISGGPLVDMIVRLTGVEIEIRDLLENTLEEILEFRGDLVQAFDESGALVSDTAELMQRNESSRDLVISEQNRINRELIKAVLKYLILNVVLPIITAILGAMIQLAATAIGAAVGAAIPIIGPAIGAAVGALIGAALAGVAAIFTSVLAVGAGAALDAFDSGGVAYGKGVMVKDTYLPERVLSPQETSSYDRIGALADMLEASNRRLEIHAPIYVYGDRRSGEVVQSSINDLSMR